MYNRIVLAGGSGFLGKALAEHFKHKSREVIILSRKPQQNQDNIYYIWWDGKSLGEWVKYLEASDLLVNLCGKNVNCRYTQTNQQEILRSRVEPTKVLAETIQTLSCPPRLWVNSGSATIYRHAEDRPQDEENGEIGDGFSVDVCKAWEAAFWETEARSTRKVLLRIGMVLGKDDSVFPYLKRLVCFGLGGYQGNGQQHVSWIHQLDFVRTIEWLLRREDQKGTFNCTAPEAVKNKDLMKLLRQAFGIPFGLPSPKWMLEIGAKIIGTETELILKSRWVYPKRLLTAGFSFIYPDAESAVSDLASPRS